MRRRGYIAHGGALLTIAVAGCSSGNGAGTPESDDATTDDEPTATDTEASTATERPLIERPAEALLLTRDQVSDDWSFAGEDLDAEPVERLFRRDQETLLYSYAQTFASVEAARESYEDHMETLGRSKDLESVDVEGTHEATVYVQGDLWLQFLERNARGAIRHGGPDATQSDVVRFAELMGEHF